VPESDLQLKFSKSRIICNDLLFAYFSEEEQPLLLPFFDNFKFLRHPDFTFLNFAHFFNLTLILMNVYFWSKIYLSKDPQNSITPLTVVTGLAIFVSGLLSCQK
jgi:hypothetical protein